MKKNNKVSTKNKTSSEKISSLVKDNASSLILGFIIFILFTVGITSFLKNYKQDKPRKDNTVVFTKSGSDDQINFFQKIRNEISDIKNDYKQKEDSGRENIIADTSSVIKKQSYTVKFGDNLWTIAERLTSDGTQAYNIANANNIYNPDNLIEGQQITIPPTKTGSGDISSLSTSEVSINTDKYTVKKGDSLWKIAVKAYGDGNMWARIVDANKLENPDYVSEGIILNLPKTKISEKKDSQKTSYYYTGQY